MGYLQMKQCFSGCRFVDVPNSAIGHNGRLYVQVFTVGRLRMKQALTSFAHASAAIRQELEPT